MKKLEKILNIFLKKKINKDELNRFKNNEKFVNEFCKKYDLSLTKVTTTYETEKPKNMYFFNDGLGGYTLDGIKKSLNQSGTLNHPYNIKRNNF